MEAKTENTLLKALIFKILDFLIKFLNIQLFITLTYLPIGLIWGLPFSYLSPLGNLIFTPILVSFLTVSSIIFFCEICSLNSNIFCCLLNKISDIWFYFLKIPNKHSLISLIKPNFFILILILVLNLAIIHNKNYRNNKRIISYQLFLFTAVICFLKLKAPSYDHKTTLTNTYNLNYLNKTSSQKYAYKSITFIRNNNKIIIIDSGALNSINSIGYVYYNLIPYLIKTEGILNIDHLISLNPGITEFKALAILCKRFSIKKLYMPKWDGKLTNSGLGTWENLLKVLKFYNTELIFIDSKEINITLSKEKCLILKPKDKINRNKLTYSKIEIEN